MKLKEVLERQQKELERIGAEERNLGDRELSCQMTMKSAEDSKRKASSIGNRLLALAKGNGGEIEKRIAEQDRIISEMKKSLQQIERRRNELDRTRQKKESERAQAEANARKVLVGIAKERTEVRRQQQREWEMQEKGERAGTDFGVTRLMKRGKRR